MLVADPIDPIGLRAFEGRVKLVFATGGQNGLLADYLSSADALLVRSETRVTESLISGAPRLKVIARAGAGVDNIDLEAATRRGIVVVNAPAGNTFAAAEHTLAVARRVAIADAAMQQGRGERNRFVGVEQRGKTIGLVGLGRVGAEVARRAQSFDLHVVAYDPYVSPELANRLGVELADLESLLRQADFVSIHAPLTPATRGLIGPQQLGWLKPGAILVNCAHGGLVDEQALLATLESGQLAGAGIDVWEKEPVTDNPLARHDRVVATPHLAASTAEAQAGVARQVAEQVLQVLSDRPAQFAVNGPSLPPELVDVLQPYVLLATSLGTIATQLADGQFRKVQVAVRGAVAEHDNGLLATALLRGLLGPISSDPVTLVSARALARGRGLEVIEERSADAETYASFLAVAIQTDRGQTRVAGTLLNEAPHIVGIDNFHLDFSLSSDNLLLTQHCDRPGMIGRVCTLLGDADVNISAMQVGHQAPRGEQLMVLAIDEPVSFDLLTQLRAVPGMSLVRTIAL